MSINLKIFPAAAPKQLKDCAPGMLIRSAAPDFPRDFGMIFISQYVGGIPIVWFAENGPVYDLIDSDDVRPVLEFEGIPRWDIDHTVNEKSAIDTSFDLAAGNIGVVDGELLLAISTQKQVRPTTCINIQTMAHVVGTPHRAIGLEFSRWSISLIDPSSPGECRVMVSSRVLPMRHSGTKS